MNTTTPSLLPATSRAGASGYSPDDAGALSPDTTATKSFDELCPEEDGHPRAGVDSQESTDTPEAKLSDSDDAATVDEATSEDEDDAAECRRRRAAEEMLTTTSILASVREVAPMAITLAPVRLPQAEIAAEPTDAPAPATNATPLAPENRPATPAAPAAAMRPGKGNHAEGADRERASEGKGIGQTVSELAASRNAAKPAANPPGQEISAEARAKHEVVESAGAQLPAARVVGSKAHGEKSAAAALATGVREITGAENKFLNTDDQGVATRVRSHGTRSALNAGTMNSSTTTTARVSDTAVPTAVSPAASGQGTWTDGISVDWKGWTNGGGERASTAAQFSSLGDKISHLAVSANPAAGAANRVATSNASATAPAAPTVPVEAAEALAPIHSAIERLVIHGRDQLALTVRFEQGGSLSIKLSMQNGEIATQIQTDVSGLEAALKSSWGELVQDWNSRGWKLANPEFSSNAATYHNREDALADGRTPGRQSGRDADEAPLFGGRALSPARLKHVGGVALSGLETLRAAARARSGIHTWA